MQFFLSLSRFPWTIVGVQEETPQGFFDDHGLG